MHAHPGKELRSSPPSNEPVELIGKEEQGEANDLKSKVKKRKSIRWQSRRKPVGVKLPTILTEVCRLHYWQDLRPDWRDMEFIFYC